MFAKQLFDSGRALYLCCLLPAIFCAATDARAGDDFDQVLKPLFAENCTRCHGGEKPKGKVNLEEIKTAQQMLGKPQLIEEIIDVLDDAAMPPEDEPALSETDRERLLASLKVMLRESTSREVKAQMPLRRLNRFQYNNSVKDLFQLKSDVFRLPEKLMTRHRPYLNEQSGKMPDRVEVSCRSMELEGGLSEVRAYPQDLRAAHGFDNQANQLTLSPLLLDAFLRLSVSIVESPDFNEGTVGIWNTFFKVPDDTADLEVQVWQRLAPFLRQAFRSPVDDATLGRYTAYTMLKIEQGLPFTESMKKVAAAALSSPLFIYRHESAGECADPFGLASNLSFFLWGSSPDLELLSLAESGELAQPEVLRKTVERMLADPQIERFLDAFPAQWMQLENLLAATPDPGKQRLFSVDKSHPASLQMMLEPLLLFDAIFIEDRPVVELIAPEFSYQSDFLKTWYTSDLKPAELDVPKITAENQAREAQIKTLEATVATSLAAFEAQEKSLPSLIDKALEGIDVSLWQAQWEASQEKLLTEDAVLSTWHRIGPFSGGSFDEAHTTAFIDEAHVDLAKAYGKLTWTEEQSLVDGKSHTLTGSNCGTYLYRTIHSATARPLEVSLGSDDSFKMWLNGKLIAENKTNRGLAPDQERLQLELDAGENTLLMKIVNGGGGYGFYFKAQPTTLPGPVLATLKVEAAKRSAEQKDTLAEYYRTIAPELAPVRAQYAEEKIALSTALKESEVALQRAPKPKSLEQRRQEKQQAYDNGIRNKLRSRNFVRVAATDPRYGGVITNAAMMSMTSGPLRTHPIARGAWILEVIFNDPPAPPPIDVPPLDEGQSTANLTIRERFAQHRDNPNCASCHSRLDPMGFALENFDITGRWRDAYENGRDVDATGSLLNKYDFTGVVQFKEALVKEERRFAKAFTAHLLRFALSRELSPRDSLTIEDIVNKTEEEDFKLKSIIREVAMSVCFQQAN